MDVSSEVLFNKVFVLAQIVFTEELQTVEHIEVYVLELLNVLVVTLMHLSH